eukprot:7712619-Pyramimonas_sp.AAC.1
MPGSEKQRPCSWAQSSRASQGARKSQQIWPRHDASPGRLGHETSRDPLGQRQETVAQTSAQKKNMPLQKAAPEEPEPWRPRGGVQKGHGRQWPLSKRGSSSTQVPASLPANDGGEAPRGPS